MVSRIKAGARRARLMGEGEGGRGRLQTAVCYVASSVLLASQAHVPMHCSLSRPEEGRYFVKARAKADPLPSWCAK